MSCVISSRRGLHGLTLGALLVCGANPASARPEFPGDLANDLGMPCTPQCTVCHKTNDGGIGTLKFIKVDGANKPGFGRKLTTYGLDFAKRDSLKTALDAAEADGSDVDNDGIPDVTELKAGEDPNDPTSNAPIACASDSSDSGGCAIAGRPHTKAGIASLSSVLLALAGIAVLRRRFS